jgi:hypothetical protein
MVISPKTQMPKLNAKFYIDLHLTISIEMYPFFNHFSNILDYIRLRPIVYIYRKSQGYNHHGILQTTLLSSSCDQLSSTRQQSNFFGIIAPGHRKFDPGHKAQNSEINIRTIYYARPSKGRHKRFSIRQTTILLWVTSFSDHRLILRKRQRDRSVHWLCGRWGGGGMDGTDEPEDIGRPASWSH